MRDRRHKVHYVQNPRFDIGMCGLTGAVTHAPNDMTCHICMFRYLSAQTTWGQSFLDGLRGRLQPTSVIVPARTPEPADGKVVDAGYSQGCTLSYERITEETISKILPISPAFERTVKEVMDNGGPAAESVWIQPRQVTEQSGDAGEVGDESRRYYKAD